MSGKKFKVSLDPPPGHRSTQLSDQESDSLSQDTSVYLVDERDIEAANENAAEAFAMGATRQASRILLQTETSGSSSGGQFDDADEELGWNAGAAAAAAGATTRRNDTNEFQRDKARQRGEQSDLSEETSVSDFSGLEAQTVPAFPENIASCPSAKATRDFKATNPDEDMKCSNESRIPLVEAKPVRSRPAYVERPPPPLRPEAYPLPHPIEPEYPKPTPPPPLPPPQSQDEEQQDKEPQSYGKRYWRWITVSLVLLVAILGVVLGVVLGRGATPEDQANEWSGKDVEANGFNVRTDEDRITARNALAILFYSTNGDGWDDKTGWLDHGVTECDWYGVECSSSAVATKLMLHSNNLKGKLPTQLGQLSNLEYLSVRSNLLTGSIPTQLGELKSLNG